MSRLTAIKSILSGESTITDVVGTRIYPILPPQKSSFPQVVFTLGNTDPTDQKDGASPLDEDRLQIDVYAKTATQGESLDSAIRTAIDNYSGTSEGVVIRRIFFTDFSPPKHDPDIGVFWFSSDYRIKIET